MHIHHCVESIIDMISGRTLLAKICASIQWMITYPNSQILNAYFIIWPRHIYYLSEYLLCLCPVGLLIVQPCHISLAQCNTPIICFQFYWYDFWHMNKTKKVSFWECKTLSVVVAWNSIYYITVIKNDPNDRFMGMQRIAVGN